VSRAAGGDNLLDDRNFRRPIASRRDHDDERRAKRLVAFSGQGLVVSKRVSPRQAGGEDLPE
jgi:hypothetical protein